MKSIYKLKNRLFVGILAVLLAFFTIPVNAYEEGEVDTYVSRIPVEIEEALDSKAKIEQLEGPYTNLPEKTTIDGSGEFVMEFKDAHEGDVFKYRITEVAGTNSKVTYNIDNKTYICEVWIFVNPDNGVVYARSFLYESDVPLDLSGEEGESVVKPDKCTFKNKKVTDPTPSPTPTPTPDIVEDEVEESVTVTRRIKYTYITVDGEEAHVDVVQELVAKRKGKYDPTNPNADENGIVWGEWYFPNGNVFAAVSNPHIPGWATTDIASSYTVIDPLQEVPNVHIVYQKVNDDPVTPSPTINPSPSPNPSIVPDTRDTSRLLMYEIVFAISLMTIIFVIYKKRKIDNEE